MILDVGIMWMLLFYAIKIVKNNARTIQIFKGIILILIVDGFSKLLGLATVSWLAGMFVNWGFLAVIIVFQPEIRSVLEKIGKSNMFSRISALTGNEKEQLVDVVVGATMLLANSQTGALITIEQSQALNDYIKTGTKINSEVSLELLTSIFVTSTPLHDGAVIIQGDRIACASAYFPLTNAELPSRYGTRHRAAVGISELTDAVTIVISEETGRVSITEGGKIFHVDRKGLREYLIRVICGEATEVAVASVKKPKFQEAIVIEREEVDADGEDEYVIEPAKIEEIEVTPEQPIVEEPKEETSLLGRLAIKRYGEKEEVGEIEPIEEEAIEATEEVKEEVVEEKPKKKKLFSFFGKKNKNTKEAVSAQKTEEETLADLEENIKLPHRRETVQPIVFEEPKNRELREPVVTLSTEKEETDSSSTYRTSMIRAMGEDPAQTAELKTAGAGEFNTGTHGLSGEEFRKARVEAIRSGHSIHAVKKESMEHPIHNQELEDLVEDPIQEEKRETPKFKMDFSDQSETGSMKSLLEEVNHTLYGKDFMKQLEVVDTMSLDKAEIEEGLEIDAAKNSQTGGNQ